MARVKRQVEKSQYSISLISLNHQSWASPRPACLALLPAGLQDSVAGPGGGGGERYDFTASDGKAQAGAGCGKGLGEMGTFAWFGRRGSGVGREKGVREREKMADKG